MRGMISVGYMAKTIVEKPGWLKAPAVRRICSVSGCISKNFTDFIRHWRHNERGFFDSMNIIVELAAEEGIDLSGMQFFHYEEYERQYDEKRKQWEGLRELEAAVLPVAGRQLVGYDVVTFSQQAMPECSPLSCNGLAETIGVNDSCLLPSLEVARDLLEAGAFDHSEPGPFRVFSVYTLSR